MTERRWERVLLALTAFLVSVLLLITIVFQLQVAARNKDIRTIKGVVAEAKAASEGAKKSIDDAVAAGQKGAQAEAIRKALETIQLIERQVQQILDPHT